MNADTIRAQQDSFKRWRDKASENSLRGATELPYIKPGRTFFRHRETFNFPKLTNGYIKNLKTLDTMPCPECRHEKMIRLKTTKDKDEFYCEQCRFSIPLFKI